MDIIERLRKFAELEYIDMDIPTAMAVAADEIERLQKEVMAWWKETEIMRSDLAIYSEEIERLREALRSIASNTCCDKCQETALVARAALKEDE